MNKNVIIKVIGKKTFFSIQAYYFFFLLVSLALQFLQTEKLKVLVDFYFTEMHPFSLQPILDYVSVLCLYLVFKVVEIFAQRFLCIILYEKISTSVVNKFLKLQWYDVYSRSASDTVKLINNDINKITPVIFGFYPHIVINIVTCVFFAVYLGLQFLPLLILILPTFILLYFVGLKFDKILKTDSEQLNDWHLQKENCILSIFNNFKAIYANKMEDATSLNFNKINASYNKAAFKISQDSSLSSFFYSAITLIVSLLVILLLIRENIKTQSLVFTAGFLMQATTLVSKALTAFNSFLARRNNLSASSASFDRINDLFNKDIAEHQIFKLPKTVSFTYSDGCVKSASIQTHKVNLIFGGNGCGKTTLLNKLSGLNHRYFPEITFSDYDESETKVAYMTIEKFIFGGTVAEYLGCDSLLESDSKMHIDYSRILKACNLNLNTKIQTAWDKSLSAGQAQILHLLKLVKQDADVFLMDEPETSLDENLKQEVYNIINKLVTEKDKTILMISHYPDCEKYFDKSIVNKIIL